MPTDEVLKQLHEKATRGMTLSPAEQASLDAWYEQHDGDEAAALAGMSSSQALAALQAQVEAATARLVTVTHKLQSLAAENENLRREIALLQKQVTQRSTAQPA